MSDAHDSTVIIAKISKLYSQLINMTYMSDLLIDKYSKMCICLFKISTIEIN